MATSTERAQVQSTGKILRKTAVKATTRRRERRSHQLSRKERRSYKLRQPRPIICKMDSKKPANAVRSVCPVKVMARTTRNDQLLPWRHQQLQQPRPAVCRMQPLPTEIGRTSSVSLAKRVNPSRRSHSAQVLPRSDAPHKKIRDSVSQWVTQCQVLHL